MSAVSNALALTGSFYMLQVYDRVLSSHSVPTLVGLTALMLGLYALYGVLDALRSQIVVRLGLRIDRSLRDLVYRACAGAAPAPGPDGWPDGASRP